MAVKVKGLLKGLRYISQIFDDDEEEEMKIGLPTDVKHVAHIGWDGPSVDSPSWMKGFEPSEEGVKEKSRRHQSKESSENNKKSNRDGNNNNVGSAGNNIPKKSRKKKKDPNSSRPSKLKGSAGCDQQESSL